jgi:hypothetical protein
MAMLTTNLHTTHPRHTHTACCLRRRQRQHLAPAAALLHAQCWTLLTRACGACPLSHSGQRSQSSSACCGCWEVSGGSRCPRHRSLQQQQQQQQRQRRRQRQQRLTRTGSSSRSSSSMSSSSMSRRQPPRPLPPPPLLRRPRLCRRPGSRCVVVAAAVAGGAAVCCIGARGEHRRLSPRGRRHARHTTHTHTLARARAWPDNTGGACAHKGVQGGRCCARVAAAGQRTRPHCA